MKRLPIPLRPATFLQVLRSTRTLGLSLLEPVDYASRVINNKRRLPPVHLRREVGDLSSFESSGGEFMAYCKLLANVHADERVLDIGCGCGLMALFFEDYLDSAGQYVGVDIQSRPVRWCRKHISSRSPNFKFIHLDLPSQRYNPGGDPQADFRIPEDDHSFDFIFAKSVFTHLLPKHVERYIAEISRLLSEDGRCLASVFLFTEGRTEVTGMHCHLRFEYGNDTYRYQSEQIPETAVAYSESYIRRILSLHNLVLQEPIRYGAWSGRADGLSFQDLLVITRRGN